MTPDTLREGRELLAECAKTFATDGHADFPTKAMANAARWLFNHADALLDVADAAQTVADYNISLPNYAERDLRAALARLSALPKEKP